MIRVSLPARLFALVVLCLGALLVPTQAMAAEHTVSVAPGCSVTYDSGHVVVDPWTGTVDYQAPSAGAEVGGCVVINKPCCIVQVVCALVYPACKSIALPPLPT